MSIGTADEEQEPVAQACYPLDTVTCLNCDTRFDSRNKLHETDYTSAYLITPTAAALASNSHNRTGDAHPEEHPFRNDKQPADPGDANNATNNPEEHPLHKDKQPTDPGDYPRPPRKPPNEVKLPNGITIYGTPDVAARFEKVLMKVASDASDERESTH
jgi:hypothetical protein